MGDVRFVPKADMDAVINLFLVPASAAVPAATKQQNEDQNNDEKRIGVHVYLRVLYFGALRTNKLQSRSGPHRVGHRLARWPFSLNCRIEGWTCGSSPINARQCVSSLLSHM
jgi:hypothetical protein